MVKRADETIIGSATAVVSCYCSADRDITVNWPSLYTICPDCGSILSIDWNLNVTLDMVTPSTKYIEETLEWKEI